MKKTLLWQLIMLLLPFGVMAQGGSSVIRTYSQYATAFTTGAFNGQMNITASAFENGTSQIVALNDRMQVVWRSGVQGTAVATGAFKGKVYVAVTAPGGKPKSMVFGFYLLDPANGAVLSSKIVHTVDDVTAEIKALSDPTSSVLKLVIRTSAAKFGSTSPSDKGFNTTTDITVVDANEKGEYVISKVPAGTGTLFGININSSGRLFLSWLRAIGSVEVECYEAGKKDRTGVITLAYDMRDKDERETENPAKYFRTLPSATEPDVVYQAIVHTDRAKDRQLSIAKMNFKDNSKQIAVQSLEKDETKIVKSAYVEVNPQTHKPDIGSSDNMQVGYLGEDADNLVVAVAAKGWGSKTSFTPASESINGQAKFSSTNMELYRSPIINVYGHDLQLKGQQIFPVVFTSPTNLPWPIFPLMCRISGGNLYVVANDLKTTSLVSQAPAILFGMLDLKTQKWTKQFYMNREAMPKIWSINFGDAMWFDTGCILNFATTGQLFKMNFNVNLQYNGF